MKMAIEKRDLFTVPSDYYLAHCISDDFAFGKGIALEFQKRFQMRDKLNKFSKEPWRVPNCILIENVFNLVTKEKYWHKPTYDTLKGSLEIMKDMCKIFGVSKVAMPIIGCGLDKLQWSRVSEIIQEVFNNIDIEILVCYK